MKKYLPILLIFIVSCNSYQVRISSILDGDTAVTEKGERIRFNNIDAPELHQIYGQEAKQFVSNLILNKTVKLVTHGKDKYGRTIADIYINGLCVNEEEVKAGMCWAYARYTTHKFYLEERQAKENRVGLWAYNSPEPPFLYRKEHKKNN